MPSQQIFLIQSFNQTPGKAPDKTGACEYEHKPN